MNYIILGALVLNTWVWYRTVQVVGFTNKEFPTALLFLIPSAAGAVIQAAKMWW